MKTQLFALLFACVSFGWAQADIPMNWNVSLTESGRIGIHHPAKESNYTATVMVDYGGQMYNKQLTVEAGEWGFVNFPEDFDFTYEDMPDGSGVIQVNLAVQADGEMVYNEEAFLTARNPNQPYEVNIQEIADRINLYGSIIDDCIFWKDYSGYNYVIRSHHEGNPGIFMSHWVMDVSGSTERINYYKNNEACKSGRVQNQSHSIGWTLQDENEDGYMEFYSLIFDACEKSKNDPQHATLVVYTNITDLYITGTSYSLIDDSDDIGGDYEASEALKQHMELLDAAEAAWDVYITE